MSIQTCCKNLAFFCENSKNKVLEYDSRFDEYLIPLPHQSSSINIHYCPWCGSKLPDSKRGQWFDELEKIGYDDPLSQDIPERYRSDIWFKK